MKKSIILLLLFTTLINVQSFSQNLPAQFRQFSLYHVVDHSLNDDNQSYDNIKGSPYANQEFKKATISSKPNLLFYVKYNAFIDQMEVMSKNNKSYAINKSIGNVIVNFIEDNKTYQVFSYYKKDKLTTRFFNVLNPDSKLLLLKKEEVTLKSKQLAQSSYEKDKPARFKKTNDYYIKFPDKITVEELPSNKKEFAKSFPKIEKELLQYIDSEKIKLSKEADLITLFKELNRLKG